MKIDSSYKNRIKGVIEHFTKVCGDRGAPVSNEAWNKVERYLEAQKLFDKESEKRRALDQQKRARKTFIENELTKSNFLRWERQPNRYDIEGIDTR